MNNLNGSKDGVPEPAHLTWVNIAIGLLFLLLDASLSIFFQLGLSVSLLTAAARCVLQLTVMGFVLQRVFETNSPWAVAGITCLLILLGTIETGEPSPPGQPPVSYSVNTYTFPTTNLFTAMNRYFLYYGHNLPLFGPTEPRDRAPRFNVVYLPVYYQFVASLFSGAPWVGKTGGVIATPRVQTLDHRSILMTEARDVFDADAFCYGQS
ncbi:hypothetical protein FRB91_003729 [Serendipita sp. 411]|nr:hypothetical protein FRB91_003729 [Serendipita sp. 411]